MSTNVLFVSQLFFFFKQKTAYEIQYGLVGSEMCIRDRQFLGHPIRGDELYAPHPIRAARLLLHAAEIGFAPVSYTHLTLPTSDLV